MRAGPLRRLIAGFGLLALLPIAWMVAQGDITPAAAGLRAGIVLAVVLGVGRVADLILSAAAQSFERQALTAAMTDRRAPVADEGAGRGE